MGLPIDISSEGHRIDSLLRFAHLASAILGTVALLWLAVVIVRDRRSKTAAFIEGTTWRHKSVPLAFGALVLVGVDGYLFYRSHVDLSKHIYDVDAALEEEDVIRVQIAGRQWAWDVRYAGSDEVFGTADDVYLVGRLVVPAGRAVVYELSALDVVHAFAMPQLRTKQDAIPGAVVRGWFRARTEGQYTIACAQYCGFHHYLMSGQLEVLSSDAFDAWYTQGRLDAQRMDKEHQRALTEENSRLLQAKLGEDAKPPVDVPVRDWGWPWGAPSFVPMVAPSKISPAQASFEDYSEAVDAKDEGQKP